MYREIVTTSAEIKALYVALPEEKRRTVRPLEPPAD
jgi:hypothetical protein